MAPVRIGILGAAAITGKNRRGITATGGAAVVAAIASRDLAKAQAWAADAMATGDCPGPIAVHGSYEELLADASIDAVYVPLPYALHERWVCAAAAAGKAVLLEKPTALTVGELERMVTACRAARVPILDGTMWHFHRRTAEMEAVIFDAARFGEVACVTSAFSFRGDEAFLANNIRCDPALEPFGALGDLGQYCIRFGLWAYRWQLPDTVRAVAHRRNAKGVPMALQCTFLWRSGGADGGERTLQFDCSFTAAFRQWAEVVGTRAVLRLEDFTISDTHDSCEFEVRYEPGLDKSHSRVVVGERRVVEVRGCNQEAEMWRAFAGAAAARRFEPEWAARSLKVQACLNAAMDSMAADGRETPVPVPALLAEL